LLLQHQEVKILEFFTKEEEAKKWLIDG